MRQVLIGLCALWFLTACDGSKSDFPVRSEAVRSEVEELQTDVTIVQLTAGNIESYNNPRNLSGSQSSAPSSTWNYRIGVGDILDITVFDHPELTTQSVAGVAGPIGQVGPRVQADGTFFFPYVEQVEARGLTPEAVREDLARQLAEFIPDPQVDVRVASYKSQAVSITGEVKAPSRQPLTDVTLTLLDAINAAGGLTEQADARRVTLRRNGSNYIVDLQAFLEQGVRANNPVLQNGDVVSVARLELLEAYLLGNIVEPSTIDLTKENITLTQAVTRVGGLAEDKADARGIFVFRDLPAGITVYQLDASNPVAYLLGARFTLMPQDVIYVASAPLYRWNRLISSILPTLTTAGAVDSLGTE